MVVNAISTAALAFVAWRLWVLSASHMRTHEVTMTLHIPHGPFSRLFAVMSALAAVACLVIVWGYLSGARRGSLRVRRLHYVTETLLAFAGLLGLAFARIPVAFSMLIVGIAGFAWKRGIPASLDQLAQTTFAAGINYELSVVPLFILMGNLVARAGMSQELFRAAYTFIGHWRGGLAMSTVVACAGFGAICGSSIATAATMTRVAYPPMRQLGYSDKLAASAIAAGGTLGILIPPSTIMVIYGIMTETNIGRLFAAGVLPGHPRRVPPVPGGSLRRLAGAGRRPGRGALVVGRPVARPAGGLGRRARSSPCRSAASTLGSSRPRKGRGSARSARSCSPWRAGRSAGARCATSCSSRRGRPRCCS